jgi:hypothetical protein
MKCASKTRQRKRYAGANSTIFYQEEPSDWQLAVKWQNGSLALELFPASGQLGENTTTRWYNAPRYKNVVFELTEAQFGVAQGKLNSKEGTFGVILAFSG